MRRLPLALFVTSFLLGVVLDRPATAAGGPFDTFTSPPCRVLDTRAPGAPGTLAAGSVLAFDVIGPLAGQGGAADCGIPTGAKGVYLNLVAVNPQGKGHLKIFPWGIAEPTASALNFQAGTNVANGLLIALCDAGGSSCTNDLSLKAGIAATDVVVDVTGFLLATGP